MASTLIFPDGVRLPTRDEIPKRFLAKDPWKEIEAAEISPGFVLNAVPEPERFSHYAEINVDAPVIWQVFCDLSEALLDGVATLLFAEIDEEPERFGTANVSRILELLSPHQYQLAHDGYLEFGLVSDENYLISEVYIAPTKHFKVWLNDEAAFREVLQRHNVVEVERLSFLDEFPRVTESLPADRTAFPTASDFAAYLAHEIATLSDDPPQAM